MKSMKLLGGEFKEVGTLKVHKEATPKPDRGKGKVTNDVESPPKLVKALLKVHLDPDTPIRVPYMIHGKLYQLTEDEIQAHLDKEEKIEQVAKEANLSKPELIKVVQEEATKAGVDPKIFASAKGGQEFKKIQDAEIKVHNREYSKKIKRSREFRKKRIEKYKWATSSILKPKTITDVKIHPNTKPIAMTMFRGTEKRNFDVHNPFNIGDFGVTEWDKLREIIPKKKNKILPEGISFVNNMVIEQPEYGMFFTDVFGDEVFQRMSDIHKVNIETLMTYLVMASKCLYS
ncbi:hypothetical protein Tco_1061228 [Tanacetum coccineum]